MYFTVLKRSVFFSECVYAFCWFVFVLIWGNLRGHLNLRIQFTRRTKTSFCLFIKGVKLWNNIKENIKQRANIKHFKYKYKLYIYSIWD